MQSFVYIEPFEEDVDLVTKQITSKVKKIPKDIRGPLKGITIGAHLEGKESLLSGLVEELIVVKVPPKNEKNTEVISNILTDIVAGNGPGVLFLGFTHQGMELGPSVGWRLGIPVVTACSGLNWTQGTAEVQRSILGGNFVVSSVVDLEKGAVISVQRGGWKDEVESDTPAEAPDVTRVDWNDAWAPRRSEIIGISEEAVEGEEDIRKADLLVSVGRGMGDPENLPIMEELAKEIGGKISCSRPVVDLRWLPASRQVGISGKTVAPIVYLALGISGQMNHVAGMDASGTIIAVNKDPSAPIFKIAKYGVADDILEFVPELIEQLKKG